jgi:beta-glucosidase
MTGLELRRNRIDAILGPGMNIHRHPLNGRNFEYFSEDPLLTGRMAVACLEGLHEYGVTGTIKHFAGNNQEKGRGSGDSVVSERALREIYLKGFEMAVKEGKATTVMSTYGALNGIWTAGNYDLLTTVLRRDWGFAGLVMTDWWAKINEDGEAEASSRNTHYMVRAQNELYMVTNDSAANTNGDLLEEGLRQGMVTRGDLVRNAANICRVVMALPVMQRFLGRSPAEELAAAESSSAETAPFDLVYQPVDRELSLDLAGLTSTARGASALFALHFAQPGKYDITLRLRSEAGELAQMPVTIFRDGWVAAAITVTGTDGRWIEETRDLGEVHNPNLYLKLYFGQGGLEIGEIKVKLRKEG